MSVLLSLLGTLRTSAHSRAALQLEVLALRHQLQVLQRTRLRLVRLATADRCLWVVLSRLWTEWRTAPVIVKPETVIAWHRRGFTRANPKRPRQMSRSSPLSAAHRRVGTGGET